MNRRNNSEGDLFLSMLKGDIDAGNTLTKRINKPAQGIAFKKLVSRGYPQDLHTESQNVVQEAWLQASLPNNARHYDVNRPFSPWFFKIVSNQVHRLFLYYNRNGRSLCLPIIVDDESWDRLEDRTTNPELAAQRREIRNKLRQFARDLSESFSVFASNCLLMHLEGYSNEEIQLALDRPAGSVKQTLSEARRRVILRMQETLQV